MTVEGMTWADLQPAAAAVGFFLGMLVGMGIGRSFWAD